MLDRMINPVDQMEIEITPHGIFGIPEELERVGKEVDVLDYKIEIFGQTIRYGQIFERELTEEEKEQLKKKKGKKGETEETTEPIIDPEYEKLSDQEKLWWNKEDKFKNSALRWKREHQDEKLL